MGELRHKIKIDGKVEYDLEVRKEITCDVYVVRYSKGKQWNPSVRGTIAMQVVDYGSGLRFTQRKNKSLDYDEAQLLKILLTKYIK